MKAQPSVQRVDNILLFVIQFRLGRQLSYITLSRQLGKLTSIIQVVPLGLLSLQLLQKWLNSFHLDARVHRHRKLVVTQLCLGAL